MLAGELLNSLIRQKKFTKISDEKNIRQRLCHLERNGKTKKKM
jgi:hypothetical protein